MQGLMGRHLSRRAGIAFQLVVFPLILVLIPWAFSLLGIRHGWTGDAPGPLNYLGLLPVAAGFCILVWCSHEHFGAAPDGWLLEKTPHYPTPSYLLTTGPYRYSCHPIYLAEFAILLGWVLFYGSFVLAGMFGAAAVLAGTVIVPREERGLEARFGDSYLKFRRNTPRWLGKRRDVELLGRPKSNGRENPNVR